jgi:hypothetical protein
MTITSTINQKDLPLFQHSTAPEDANVRWLENLLCEAKDWKTAAEIAEAASGRVSDRDIRALASASAWIISGQKGYKHLEHSTPEESAHAKNWLISQGKLMIKRGLRIGRNAHRRIG